MEGMKPTAFSITPKNSPKEIQERRIGWLFVSSHPSRVLMK
jgi:hypothetical protein